MDTIKTGKKTLDEIGMKNYVLFGNKIDKKEWQISTEEFKKYVEENNMNYQETSCITKEGIIECFSYFINDLYFKIKNGIDNNINIKKKKTKKDSNNSDKKGKNNK